MNIAFLSISSGQVDRGAEVWVAELAKRLQKTHQVTVIQCGRKRKSVYTEHVIGHVPLRPHQSTRWSLSYHVSVLIFTIKSLVFLWRERFDWVIPINGYSQAVLCRVLQWIRGGKVLIVGHAGVGRDDRFNIMFGKPDVFVALTKRACEWAKNFGRMQYAPTKILHIPNGVDTDIFHPVGPVEPITLKRPVVLCVSALVPYKRIELLISAVVKTHASLLLIGDGSERESIICLAKKELGDRFMHVAHVPHDQMSSYYRAADVFSLPSEESEAFGLVYLEAMACNVPVVAPDDESRKMLVGQGGIVCPVENEHEYTRALKKALSTQWENTPRKQAEKFSWDNISVAYVKIFRAIPA